ncbi:MAG: hypothetical protein AAGC84_12250 [Pseudomonas sp.]
MHILLELKDEAFANYLNTALRSHGVNSEVSNIAVDAEGQPLFSIICLRIRQMTLARHLIYSSRSFIADIESEAVEELLEIRRQHRQMLLARLTSQPALWFSAAALTIAALGYWFDW